MYHFGDNRIGVGMTNNKSWFERNKKKSIRTLVDKSFILDTAAVLMKSGYLQRIALPPKLFLDGLQVRIDINEVLTEEAFYNIFLPLMNDQGNQEDAIEAFTHNPLFRKFMSELLYNNIKGFLLDKNFLKQVPIAGRVLKAGQTIGKKAGERFSGLSSNIELRIKSFIEQNIGTVTNFTVNYARKATTPDTIENILEFVWDHLQHQRIAVRLNLNNTAELDIEAVILHLLDALIEGVLEKYGDKKLGDFPIFFN
ncbi:hypothetical protein OLMES_4162 [Oleiphilus messinensis]|uniref:Uncharacterized protein n=2 Tax=Oleiphilus messinensis TaxID=141451 RepID=A0A1Y0ICB9_9GAMM|nr:hypothetical protein OLMES_4162 [Oleiphilus messinensis]